MMTYFVYILYNQSHSRHYVGSTRDVERRIAEHNAGKSHYTKGRRPWVLVHQEAYPTLTAARKREIYLKTGQGREYIKKLLTK